jgi:hypothetical protein
VSHTREYNWAARVDLATLQPATLVAVVGGIL